MSEIKKCPMCGVEVNVIKKPCPFTDVCDDFNSCKNCIAFPNGEVEVIDCKDCLEETYQILRKG